jgi:hypothetical protein
MRRFLARTSILGSCWLVGLSLHCGGNEPSKAQWCEDTSSEAASRSYAAISDAERSCSADSDCAVFRNPLTCISGCGFGAPVASAAVAELERNIQTLSDEYCAPFEAAECLGPIALPCVPPPGREVPTCADKQCTITIIPWDELTE